MSEVININYDKISTCLEQGLQININENIAGMLNSQASVVTFQAKEVILHEGEKSLNLYYILNGIVRGYYTDNQGNDITKCFSYENGFFSSEGLRTRESSSFSIECLEMCQCIRLPYSLIDEIIQTDDHLKEIFHRLYIMEVEKLEKRAKNLILMSAEERYIDFCSQCPELFRRIDLQYIASYIGIRAASLSRIRKEMKK
ncbi:CRP-like cAMP-binding protein [Kineothrix alysoides]|uniref:CRP-like cAMP-binding protein n=1 Tax=Kineothrix alysoides TaxID=1469948 RepID=A0A4R1R518_9FIRM|nr:Crp/Fnr family transcriptional regulator [Kineothrix alysoides]TCL60510.1 CRP-like cAMP-binding protein [Kineothrix alysoides]